MYDFRPVRNEVCVYLKYHLELAVSGIFERREGSNDTNLKFQPQIMEKLRLLTLLFLTVVIAACQKDPTQNGSSDPDVVSFQGSVSFKTVDPAEKGLDLIWNADVDRIGLFAADGETVEHANIYYAAFSSAANTQFVCPSQDRRIVWSAGAASRDFYAYYPYRTTYDDLTAVPVAIAAKQKGAAGCYEASETTGQFICREQGCERSCRNRILAIRKRCRGHRTPTCRRPDIIGCQEHNVAQYRRRDVGFRNGVAESAERGGNTRRADGGRDKL